MSNDQREIEALKLADQDAHRAAVQLDVERIIEKHYRSGIDGEDIALGVTIALRDHFNSSVPEERYGECFKRILSTLMG